MTKGMMALALGILPVVSSASASDCTHYAKEALEIRTKVRPKLEEIRAEKSLQSKIDSLLAEMDLAQKAIQIAPRNPEIDLLEIERLNGRLKSISPLIRRRDLNAEELHSVTRSVNTILDRLVWNSKMVESELQEYQKSCQVMDEEGNAPLFEKLKFGWRALIYSTRIGIVNAFPALYTSGAYNLAITRLEQIENSKADSGTKRKRRVDK